MSRIEEVQQCIQHIKDFLAQMEDEQEDIQSVFFTATVPSMQQGKMDIAGFAAGDVLQMEAAITSTAMKIMEQFQSPS